MAQVGISEAGRLVGRDRGTIHRYIKQGKLSATINTLGKRVIDTAELQRVFGVLSAPQQDNAKKSTVAENNRQRQDTGQNAVELVATLRSQIEDLRAEKNKLYDMLQRAQEERQQLILALGSTQTAQQPQQATVAGQPQATGQAPQQQSGLWQGLKQLFR